jgi:hypothetical protein
MKFVKINTNGEMFDMDENINLKNINKLLSNNHSTKISQLYTWNYNDSTIICYGCIDGNAGNENKHDLPPNGEIKLKKIGNSDTQLLFGDIYIIMRNKKICNMDVADYSLFYSECFQGFDDCVSDDDDDDDGPVSDSNDDNNSLNDFIVSDGSEIDMDYDYELDEDLSEY